MQGTANLPTCLLTECQFQDQVKVEVVSYMYIHHEAWRYWQNCLGVSTDGYITVNGTHRVADVTSTFNSSHKLRVHIGRPDAVTTHQLSSA